MNRHTPPEGFSIDLMDVIARADLGSLRRRDMTSAVSRMCEMIGCAPQAVPANVPLLRARLAKVLHAAHGVSAKTFANLKSLFLAALALADLIDLMPSGDARKDPCWGPLMAAIAHDKRWANGLAAFANWCTLNGIHPDAVSDDHVTRFHGWLERRTLCAKPRDRVRQVPKIWNEAAAEIADWPENELTPLSFKAPLQHLSWAELDEGFRHDAEVYLETRKNPDVFDESVNAPKRPLAESTIRLQSAHIRLAASILVRSGTPVEEITSLADLVEPEAFKAILRHYHEQADGKENAFVIGVARTLQQVAKYHVGLSRDELERLKVITSKLPAIKNNLTEKNKALLREFDSETTKARLLYLPEDLLDRAKPGLDNIGRVFVDAQVAIAVDIELTAPLRPQNLTTLNWHRHFVELDGSRGRLTLHIPADETKTKERDLTYLLPDDAASRIRWYRREILPRLGADPTGDLFVNFKGVLKDQKTFTSQIIKRIETHVGIHMTPHQFRHLAAKLYLDARPQDFRTVTDLLGHANAKTTQIYAGLSNDRASKVYTSHIIEQQKTLQLKRRRKRKR